MREEGSATLLVLTLVSALVLVAIGMAAAGRLLAAHTQATAAADAAALAAAPLTFFGGDPRAEAVEYAAANGARLVACGCPVDVTFRTRVVTVEVTKSVTVPIFGELKVRARASAEFRPLDLLGG